jgi:hypothetical protein
MFSGIRAWVQYQIIDRIFYHWERLQLKVCLALPGPFHEDFEADLRALDEWYNSSIGDCADC